MTPLTHSPLQSIRTYIQIYIYTHTHTYTQGISRFYLHVLGGPTIHTDTHSVSIATSPKQTLTFSYRPPASESTVTNTKDIKDTDIDMWGMGKRGSDVEHSELVQTADVDGGDTSVNADPTCLIASNLGVHISM